MRSNKYFQAGFSVFEVLLVTFGLAAIAAVGLKVYDTHATLNSTAADTTSQLSLASKADKKISPAVEIKTATDLDKAQQNLDQNDPNDDSADSAALDSQLEF